MTTVMSEESARALRQAAKTPLLPLTSLACAPVLGRDAVEAILPHRDPFLFIDRVMMLDLQSGMVAACYDLVQARDVFAGHFPNHPIWPGVLQVEAIGQAGILLHLVQMGTVGLHAVTLTHVLSARFLRPVRTDGEVYIVARTFAEGLLVTIVGQCLYEGSVCSVAAVNVLADGSML